MSIPPINSKSYSNTGMSGFGIANGIAGQLGIYNQAPSSNSTTMQLPTPPGYLGSKKKGVVAHNTISFPKIGFNSVGFGTSMIRGYGVGGTGTNMGGNHNNSEQ